VQRSTPTQTEDRGFLELGEIPGPDVSDTSERWTRLIYQAHFGYRPLELSVYRPRGATEALPCIVWIHGGAFAMGTRTHLSDFLKDADFFETVAQRGFVIATIEYRLSAEAIWPAQIVDVHDAILWLQKNAEAFGLDPRAMFTWGESAGAHLSAMAALREPVLGSGDEFTPLAGALAWYPPTDFSLMDVQAGDNSDMNHDEPLSPESRLVGGPVQEMHAIVQDANPANFVTPLAPPFLIRHGSNDRLVPSGQSQLLVDALKAHGVPVDFELFEGVGHGFEGKPDAGEQIFVGLDFINAILTTSPTRQGSISSERQK
jgi:acetyl esterase/lipase